MNIRQLFISLFVASIIGIFGFLIGFAGSLILGMFNYELQGRCIPYVIGITILGIILTFAYDIYHKRKPPSIGKWQNYNPWDEENKYRD